MPKSSTRHFVIVYGLLLAVSLALLWFWMLPSHKLGPEAFKMSAMISVAGISAVVLLDSSFRLLRFGKPLGLPASILAPIIQAAMMALIASLGTTSPLGIQRPPEALAPATLWLEWKTLALCAFAQALSLMAYGAVHAPGLDSDDRPE